MPEHEFFTDPQRVSRLPKRPWHIHVYENGGTTSYQVQADNGELVCTTTTYPGQRGRSLSRW
jgi:hypothetical protein